MKTTKLFLSMMLVATLLGSCKDDQENEILPPADVDYSGIVLNEICGAGPESTDPEGEDDWVEIYNLGISSVDLTGVQVMKIDEEGASVVMNTLAQEIPAGGYIVLRKSEGQLAKKISNTKQVGIQLLTPAGVIIDEFDRDNHVGKDKGHNPGESYARIPNGTGSWNIAPVATPETNNTTK